MRTREPDRDAAADSGAERSVSALAASSGAVPDTQLAPFPSAISASQVRRAFIRLIGLALIAVVAAVLLPGLGELRERFVHADSGWILSPDALWRLLRSFATSRWRPVHAENPVSS